jgi:hypothetical protein
MLLDMVRYSVESILKYSAYSGAEGRGQGCSVVKTPACPPPSEIAVTVTLVTVAVSSLRQQQKSILILCTVLYYSVLYFSLLRCSSARHI